MTEQTLPVAPTFPDGTEVELYDAEGWSSFPSSGGPPGSPLQTKTVEGGSVTFTELEANHPYFAAAKIGGAWRYISFIHDAENPADWYGSGVTKPELAAEKSAREARDGELEAEIDSYTIVNVKEHGAKGDGVTDDSEAIQAALDVINPAVGGAVLLPAGHTFIAEGLQPESRTTLFGGGRLLHKANSSLACLETSTSVSHVNIEGIEIDGNKANQIVEGLVSVKLGGAFIRFKGNYCHDLKLDGIAVQPNATDVSVLDNHVDGTGRLGIAIISTSGADAPQRISVRGNHVLNTTDAALGIVGVGKHVLFADNVLYATVNGDGISAYDRENFHITCTGNVIISPGNHGIHLGGSWLAATGNDIYGPQYIGIFVASDPNGEPTAGEQFVVAANNIDRPGKALDAGSGSGVTVENQTGGAVVGNVINAPYSHGVNLVMCTGLSVGDNSVDGSTVGVGFRVYASTRISVDGNVSRDNAGAGMTITDSGGEPTSAYITLNGNVVTGNNGGGIIGSAAAAHILLGAGNIVRENTETQVSLGTGANRRVGDGNSIEISTSALTAGSSMVIPVGSSVFHVANGGTITSINSSSGWRDRRITLIFDGVTNVADAGNISIAGGFASTAFDTLTLVSDGTNWFEISRSVN